MTKKAKAARVDPVFFENWPDNNHCLQATVMTALNSLGVSVRWEEVNVGTDYDARYYTWTVSGAKYVASKIKGARFISGLNYKEFANRGEAYLRELWSKDYFELQKAHASPSFKREQGAAVQFLASGAFSPSRPTQEEFGNLLDENLVIALTHYNRLYPGEGASSHYIVVYAREGSDVWFHDPGLPARRSRRFPLSQVYQAISSDLIVIPAGAHRFGTRA